MSASPRRFRAVDIVLASAGAAIVTPLLLGITVLGLLLLAVATGLHFSVPLLVTVGGPAGGDAYGVEVTTGPMFGAYAALVFVGSGAGLLRARRQDPARKPRRQPS
jgi:uncharacterized membrane protein